MGVCMVHLAKQHQLKRKANSGMSDMLVRFGDYVRRKKPILLNPAQRRFLDPIVDLLEVPGLKLIFQ